MNRSTSIESKLCRLQINKRSTNNDNNDNNNNNTNNINNDNNNKRHNSY